MVLPESVVAPESVALPESVAPVDGARGDGEGRGHDVPDRLPEMVVEAWCVGFWAGAKVPLWTR